MGRVYLTPIVQANSVKNTDEYGRTLMAWWKSSDYYRYNKAMLTPSPCFSWRNARERLKMPKSLQVVWDSGGYLLAIGKFNATPIEVQQWYNTNLAEHDVGMLLDYPPYRHMGEDSTNARQATESMTEE